MTEPQRGMRSILVVDDELLIRMNLVDFFEMEGFTVFEAASADQAIAMLEAAPSIQIVVTDVDMPGSMDGIRLAHFVRERWPPTVLIVSSGARAPMAEDLPIRSAFVAKPCAPQELLKEIVRLSA